jgi:hypothetical protein
MEQSKAQMGGAFPPWLAGAIPFGAGKNFHYLSTMGLNPFSQIFNPLGPEGPVQGSLMLGQGSPWIQALLSGYGVDTLRGGETPISPESGVGRDFFGGLIDMATGQETDIGREKGGSRFLATLARSFPQYRIAERGPRTPFTPFASGGRSVYPESLPWAQRFMPTKPESQFGGTIPELFEQYVGVAPHPYDLESYQGLLPKRVKYARTLNQRARYKLKRALAQP